MLDDFDETHTMKFDKEKSEEAKREIMKLLVEVQLDSPDPPIGQERFHDSLETKS
jgi:hypothetical protein